MMGLSPDEQRLLDEMERNLYKNEADILPTASGPRVVDSTRVALGILALLGGLALVVVGVATKLAVVGVAGFGLAVVGALIALSASRPATGQPREADGGKVRPQSPDRSSLMDRLSQEWDERNGRA